MGSLFIDLMVTFRIQDTSFKLSYVYLETTCLSKKKSFNSTMLVSTYIITEQ